MKTFLQYILESTKNTHLEHLEDSVFNLGIPGAKKSIAILNQLSKSLSGNSKSPVNVTVKWDGAPAIVCGINPENGKFFVATKSAFNKSPKLNYTHSDIETNHSGKGELIHKLKLCLDHLPELNIKGVLQGDLLFTNSDIKSATFNNEKLITFRPNTITYAIPENSELADKIKSASLGIVFHTTYVGKKIEDMKATFGANISNLKSTNRVWVTDAVFRDISGQCTLTKNETEQLSQILSEIKNTINSIDASIVNQFLSNTELKLLIKTYINSKIRQGENISTTKKYAKGLVDFIKTKYESDIQLLKTEKGKLGKLNKLKDLLNNININKDMLSGLFIIATLIIDAKLLLLNKLNKANTLGTFLETENGLSVTAPEGFVATDHIGNAFKLVDRLEFSKANFNMDKTW